MAAIQDPVRGPSQPFLHLSYPPFSLPPDVQRLEENAYFQQRSVGQGEHELLPSQSPGWIISTTNTNMSIPKGG
jgi:hypothetical protein